MNKNHIIVIAIFCMVSVILVAVNLMSVLLFLEFLMSSSLIWIVAALPIALVGIYIVGEWFDIWSKIRKAEKVRKYATMRGIPQKKRKEIGAEWISDTFRLYVNPKNILTMVDNFITVSRNDSQEFELMMFTNKLISSSERPNIMQIPEKNRYPICMDCFTGECFSLTSMMYMLPEGVVDWVRKHWLASVKTRADAPLDRKIHEAVATGLGFEIAKQQISTDKEEDRHEEK